jgi:ribosome biogenesis GTPase
MGTATISIAGLFDSYGEAGPPVVGDWVGIDLIGDEGVLHVILPRAGTLNRRQTGKGDLAKIAAANVDLVLVIESLDRFPNPRRIERACAIAWDGGATPVVVLTKLDLCDDADTAVARAREGAPFADVLLVSAKVGVGMDMLASRLPSGSTAVLLGPSGAGKSTLVNRLLGGARFAVADGRCDEQRGRDAGTLREIFFLPSGACLIDTPGVRELGLLLEPEVDTLAVPEIEVASRRCFFWESRQETEPGCAVQKEADLGHVNVARLASILRLHREAQNLEMGRDTARRQEIRARKRRSDTMTRETARHRNDR